MLAIYFVICSHVAPYYMHMYPQDFGMYFISEFGMLGVVLFFTASGYFILNNNKQDLFAYMFEKIKNVAKVFLIWVIIYYLYDKYVVSAFTDVGIVDFSRYLNVMGHFSEASHLWFLPCMIGLYLLVPLIRPAFIEENRSAIKKTLILFLLVSNLSILEKVLNSLFGVSPFITPSLLLSTQVTGLFNFILGGYLGLIYSGKRASREKVFMVIIIAFIGYLALTYFRRYWGHNFYYMKFYIFPLQLVCFAFFYSLANVELHSDFVKDFIAKISDKVFGIYLIHNIFVIEIYPEVIHDRIAKYFTFLTPYGYTLIYSFVVLIVAYLLCRLLENIKYVGSIIRL
ncbi:acyltransferase [Brenneria rubrifaciens]|nr:acyltransferase [Brenneria rubrifaciens]